jgi:hypothetical protein
MFAKLSSQTPSPIQQLFPMSSRQGNFTRTPGLMVTLWPIFAPKSASTKQRSALLEIGELKTNS